MLIQLSIRAAGRLRLLLLAAFMAPSLARGQDRLIVGRVTDSAGRAIPLAHVFVSTPAGDRKPDGVATLTDRDGRYRLRVTGLDSAFVAMRRIGFRGEPARKVSWPISDSAVVNWAVREVPMQLPTVKASVGSCSPIWEYSLIHPVRELWDGAVATIHARQTLLDLYSYEEHYVRTEARVGEDSRVTHDSTAVVDPPQPTIDPSFRSDPLGKMYMEGRKPMTKLWAPLDRALIDSVFVNRFCFDDAVTSAGEDYVQITFHERGRAKSDVSASGKLRFRNDVPGLASVVFTYEANGLIIGQGSLIFATVPLEGASFPLESRSLLELIDAKTKIIANRTTVERTYKDFERMRK